jgi:hypothetical protein
MNHCRGSATAQGRYGGDRGEWSASRSGHFVPGQEITYALWGREKKIAIPFGSRPPVAQPFLSLIVHGCGPFQVLKAVQ